MRAGEVVADRFEVERVVGEGGMGVVYRARDRETDEPVALKVLVARGARAAERFSREAVALRSLAHPGVVRYVSHGTTPLGDAFLAMEWHDGEDLAVRLSRRGLTVAESVALARRAARALGAAHAAGIVHRDVKPSNLFLPGGDPSRVVVLDFGIARGVVADPRRGRARASASAPPGYMAPEQARGAADVDARADVFSLGCVLYECITGRPAFAGAHAMAILAKILFDDAPRLAEVVADVPPAVDEIVARALAKDRDQRPATGDALAALLDAEGDAVLAAPSQAASLTRRERQLLCVVVAAYDGQEIRGAAPTTGRGAAAISPCRGARAIPIGDRHARERRPATIVCRWRSSTCCARRSRLSVREERSGCSTARSSRRSSAAVPRPISSRGRRAARSRSAG